MLVWMPSGDHAWVGGGEHTCIQSIEREREKIKHKSIITKTKENCIYKRIQNIQLLTKKRRGAHVVTFSLSSLSLQSPLEKEVET